LNTEIITFSSFVGRCSCV